MHTHIYTYACVHTSAQSYTHMHTHIFMDTHTIPHTSLDILHLWCRLHTLIPLHPDAVDSCDEWRLTVSIVSNNNLHNPASLTSLTAILTSNLKCFCIQSQLKSASVQHLLSGSYFLFISFIILILYYLFNLCTWDKILLYSPCCPWTWQQASCLSARTRGVYHQNQVSFIWMCIGMCVCVYLHVWRP